MADRFVIVRIPLEKYERERCTLCGKKTQYFKSTPVSERKHYIEGRGQYCEECYGKIKE